MIRVYFHICALGEYKLIFEEMWQVIQNSGLLNEKDVIVHLYSVGKIWTQKEEVEEWFRSLSFPPNVRIFPFNITQRLYERTTLHTLYDDCVSNISNISNIHENGHNENDENDENDGDIVLYLHTKGVTHTQNKSWKDPRNQKIRHWSMLMMNFLVTNYRECIKALQKENVVGVLFRPTPVPHFSGNFWWARSKYITTLPREIGHRYLDPESWVLQSTQRAISLYQNDHILYFHDVPPSSYLTNNNNNNNNTILIPQIVEW